MKKHHTIMVVHVTDRLTEAAAVQKVLTDHGRMIKTRLGLHEIDPESEGPEGLLILEILGADKENIDDLDAKLNAIDGVEAKRVFFAH
jgi:hypothetical protein